ncbi:TetR/AcrR family transcriptional regulator, partial [Tabrizicola sp.]|uniref:TetR/AcrR family transcriptional regulator n=1 Tax=Tabrizicola sp. TaxID=2005166 RepID=UPI003F3E7103
GQEAKMDGTEKSRGRPRGFDPDQVLNQAQDVFWRQGYDGTSYTDLMAATGLNKPSLYAAFGDKESLFAAALNRYNLGPGSALMNAFAASSSLRQGMETMLQGYVDLCTGGTVPCGCMAATTLAESTRPGFPVDLRVQLLDSIAKNRATMLRRAQRAAIEGDLPRHLDAEALVEFIGAFGLGIAAAAKAGSSREALRAAVATAMMIFDA